MGRVLSEDERAMRAISMRLARKGLDGDALRDRMRELAEDAAEHAVEWSRIEEAALAAAWGEES